MTAPDRMPAPQPTNTPLIGRADDIAAIVATVTREGTRLVTLTGIAGIGKSRLAMAVAERLAATMADGTYFVDLAAHYDADTAPAAVARALGVAEAQREPLAGEVARRLDGKRALLVLDNIERVGEVAPFVAALLAAPQLTILATSRAALGIAGEQIYLVPPLSLPGHDAAPDAAQTLEYGAARLFIERARAAGHEFTPTAENARDVAEICALLGGVPLAIELVAAHGGAEMVAGMHAALPAPSDPADGAPDRAATLRATITWSVDLLAAPERQLLIRLSVFVSAVTPDAAYIVGSVAGDFTDALDAVGTLCARGLLRRLSARGEEPRFAMPRAVRDFTAERLAAVGEETETRQRFASYYVTVAERTEQMLRGPDQVRWLDYLELELPNIRAALRWAFDSGATAPGLRLASGLDRFWQYHAHLMEGRYWLARGLARGATAPPAVRAKALSLAGWLERFQPGMGDAAALLAESLAIYRALDDRRGIAEVTDTLGDVAHFAGEQERARALHEENLARREELGDRWGMAMSLNSLGWIALERGDHRHAALLLHRSLALVRQLGDRRGIAMVLVGLGWAALDRDDARQAQVDMREGLALFRELGSTIDICLCLDGLAAVAAMQGAAERAARLSGAAEALREAINVDYEAITERHYTRHREAARAQADPARWAAAWEAGRALPTGQAIEEALHGSAPGA